jgi:hypothetical protein
MGDIKNWYNFSVENPEGKRQLVELGEAGRVTLDLKETGRKSVALDSCFSDYGHVAGY